MQSQFKACEIRLNSIQMNKYEIKEKLAVFRFTSSNKKAVCPTF